MKRSEPASRGAASALRLVAIPVLFAMAGPPPVATVRADEAPDAAATADAAGLSAWAMRWFTEMMAGRTDRSQYAPGFAPAVTDAAVARIAQDLSRYGAAPLRAEIIRTKRDGDQAFVVVKFVFPRGDATSLLFGFDPAGKVTGVAAGALAGD